MKKQQVIDATIRELSYVQSMQRLNQLIKGATDKSTMMAQLMNELCVIFHADRAWLFTSSCLNTADEQMIVSSTSATYPNIDAGQAISLDAELHQLLNMVLDANGEVVVEASVPTLWREQYAVQSQMLISLESMLGESWLLAVQQCSDVATWHTGQLALLKQVGARLADVLDTWQLKEKLERRTDQYVQLVENMPDGILILCAQKIVFVNEVMHFMLGDDESYLGRRIEDFIHPDFHEVSQRRFDLALQGKRNPIHAIQLLDQSGQAIDVVSSSMAISYQGKAAVQVIMRDVTRRNQIHQDLEDSLVRNKELARQVINIQEQERMMIAQNLHDDSGQLLTAMSINLQTMKQHVQGEKQLALHEDTEAIVQQLFQSLRASLATLNPTHIDVLGLSDAIRSETEVWSQRYGIQVCVDISREADFPCPEVATAIFRVIQEALTNIAKHAAASHVWVSLELEEKPSRYLVLEVRDDGCGFDKQQAQGKHFGLLGMRSRTELVSGIFSVTSQLGMGTTIYADFPVHPSHHR